MSYIRQKNITKARHLSIQWACSPNIWFLLCLIQYVEHIQVHGFLKSKINEIDYFIFCRNYFILVLYKNQTK